MANEAEDASGTLTVRGRRIPVEVRWEDAEGLVGHLVCDERFDRGTPLSLVLDDGRRFLAIVIGDDNRFRGYARQH